MKRAFALPAVLYAMAMASAIAVGGLYVTRRMHSGERLTERGSRLDAVAERVVVDAVAAWNGSARQAQLVGSESELSSGHDGAVRVSVRALKAGDRVFWLVSDASDELQPQMRRRVGLLVRMVDSVAFPVPHRPWLDIP